ncbi:hypothetical protein PTR73_17660 [Serratia nevei]|uniref:hypothetical protein n=1 Tax=Serratia nevei TaxID=2703794 RepID=UPI00313E583A
MALIDEILIKAFAKLDSGSAPIQRSDQDWQCRHRRYQYQLKEFGILQSMPRKGYYLDNACAEGFLGTLKSEFFIQRRLTTSLS